MSKRTQISTVADSATEVESCQSTIEASSICAQSSSIKKIRLAPEKEESNWGLNDDCLAAIYEYLDTEDLVRLCFVNKQSRFVVQNLVINSRSIDFGSLIEATGVTCKDLLEIVGKFMTNMSIKAKDFKCSFDELGAFLCLIAAWSSKHGSPEKLTELSLEFDFIPSNHTQQQLIKAAPFFQNIVKLRLKSHLRKQDAAVDVFLNWLFSMSFKSLRLLTMQHFIGTNGVWLTTLKNLNELRLHSSDITVMDNFESFVQSQTQLKTFLCDNNSSFDSYLQVLAKLAPSNITSFGCIPGSGIFTPVLGVMNKRIEHLKNFDCLKRIEFEAKVAMCFEIYSFLKCLPAKDMLESLKFVCGVILYDNPTFAGVEDTPALMKQFINLRNVHIEINHLASARASKYFRKIMKALLPIFVKVTKFTVTSPYIIPVLVQAIPDNIMEQFDVLEINVDSTMYLEMDQKNLPGFYRRLIMRRKYSRCKKIYVYCSERQTVEKWRNILGPAYEENLVALKCRMK